MHIIQQLLHAFICLGELNCKIKVHKYEHIVIGVHNAELGINLFQVGKPEIPLEKLIKLARLYGGTHFLLKSFN